MVVCTFYDERNSNQYLQRMSVCVSPHHLLLIRGAWLDYVRVIALKYRLLEDLENYVTLIYEF